MKRFLTVVLVLLMILSITACGKKKEVVESKTEVNTKLEKEEVVESKSESEDSKKLVEVGEVKLDYAEGFSIKKFEKGYRLITDADGKKTLLIPEGSDLPELNEEQKKYNIIKMPIKSFGIYSTIDSGYFNALEAIDLIKTVAHDKKVWQVDYIKKQMDSGEINFIGKTSALDFEKIQEINSDLNILSISLKKKVFPKFDELEIPYISFASYRERDPRGKLEWIKLVGTLLNKEDKAIKAFDNQIEKIEKLKSDNQDNKPKVTMGYFSASKKIFRVNLNNGYKGKMMDLAGGTFLPEGQAEASKNSMDTTDEEFLKIMEEADFYIYDIVSGHSIKNLEDMVQAFPSLVDTNVYKNKNIWAVTRSFWQKTENIGDMISELKEILYNKDIDEEKLIYFTRMK